MRELFVDRIGAPPVGQMVQGYLDDFDRCVIKTGHPFFIEGNMRKRFPDRHGFMLMAGIVLCKPPGKILCSNPAIRVKSSGE